MRRREGGAHASPFSPAPRSPAATLRRVQTERAFGLSVVRAGVGLCSSLFPPRSLPDASRCRRPALRLDTRSASTTAAAPRRRSSAQAAQPPFPAPARVEAAVCLCDADRPRVRGSRYLTDGCLLRECLEDSQLRCRLAPPPPPPCRRS